MCTGLPRILHAVKSYWNFYIEYLAANGRSQIALSLQRNSLLLYARLCKTPYLHTSTVGVYNRTVSVCMTTFLVASLCISYHKEAAVTELNFSKRQSRGGCEACFVVSGQRFG